MIRHGNLLPERLSHDDLEGAFEGADHGIRRFGARSSSQRSQLGGG